jgi:glyoxylase-like metal-dependent hydrolase (beta-lactamase superfamily II)
VGAIPFVAPLDDVKYGSLDQLTPLISRVIADNPSKFTYRGTGTYIIGRRDVAVIDPGPDNANHKAALEHALEGRNVVGIVVTHCHTDHVPLAAWLHAKTGAPTFAIGSHPRPIEDEVVDEEPDQSDDTVDGEDDGIREHVDHDFAPTRAVIDGEVFLRAEDWSLAAVHTPGHTSNHMCVALDVGRSLFTGDHVMGWSTTVVSPPDGNMADYIASLEKVIDRRDAILYPTHGNPVADPQPFLRAYLEHRLEREAAILRVLDSGKNSIDEIVAMLYVDVRKELHKAAGRSVLAHLVKLVHEGRVRVVDGGVARRTSRFAVI